eukprot:TRINITY_DN47249_c0_g1_i1.p3 TRINITY_DN47249_c0_g1~~TRINITY_DN47249_c0_g1_i1.p3  ORF type:complete len:328 (+),score=110.23 TRINITY_DN47249_c0_g1_i1:87-986(+)
MLAPLRAVRAAPGALSLRQQRSRRGPAAARAQRAAPAVEPRGGPVWRRGAAAAAGAGAALGLRIASSHALAETAGSAAAAAGSAALHPSLVTLFQYGPAIAVQVFFLSPLIDVQKWKKDGTTGAMQPLPYFVVPGNCFLWLVYGVLNDMNMTMLTGNAPGFLLGLWYVYNFMKYKAPGASITVPAALSASAAAVAAGAALALPTAQAINVIGLYGCAIVVAMFSGPVAAIGTVLRTKDTSSLSLPLTLAALVNCSLWFGFGWFLINDPYVWGPNSIGFAIQLAGLLMFFRFGLAKPKAA